MLNMNDKSKVINLSSNPVSWIRYTQVGDEYLNGNASVYITNSEIETQKENNNLLLNGTDSMGSHAYVFIDNEELRELLGFESKEPVRKQKILDDKKCEEMFAISSLKSFKKSVEDNVVAIHEKQKIIEMARKLKVNDHDKIQFLEEYCSMEYKS